jgi:hypothetical protein
VRVDEEDEDTDDEEEGEDEDDNKFGCVAGVGVVLVGTETEGRVLDVRADTLTRSEGRQWLCMVSDVGGATELVV